MNLDRWRPSQRARLANNLCLQCGKAVVQHPHRLCLPCRRHKRKARAKLYNSRLQLGLCPVCGSKRQGTDTIHCHACRDRNRKAHQILNPKQKQQREKVYRSRVRNERRIDGLCTDCGQVRNEAQFLTCDRCRQRHKNAWIKRATEVKE